MTNIIEIWKPIKGYEHTHAVSNIGRVKVIDRYITSTNGVTKHYKEKLLAISHNTHGTVLVKLSKSKTKVIVSRLVYNAFVKELKDDEIIKFIDGDKDNIHVTNLTSQSAKDAHRKIASKLSEVDVLFIYKEVNNGVSQLDLAKAFDVSISTIRSIRYGLVWNDITGYKDKK